MITADWLLETALRAAGLLAITALLVRTVSRSSASLRHLAWTIALGGVIAVPVLARVIPFRLAVIPAVPIAAVRDEPRSDGTPLSPEKVKHEKVKDAPLPPATAGTEPGPTPKRISWSSLLPVIWLAGSGLLVLRLTAGFIVLGSITRGARRLDEREWTDTLDVACARMNVTARPRLLLSSRVAMPCTSGWRRTLIVLPDSALAWNADRREMVLLHELAHIRRGDLVSHLVAQVACAIHWFNPVVWAAARRLRADAERAADDLVVGAGTTPSEYAAHLLDIVRGSPARREPVTVVPFAQRSEFEGRLLAILESKGGSMPSSRATLLTAALAVAAVIPVAALSAAHPSRVVATLEEAAPNAFKSKPQSSAAGRESAALLIATLSDPVRDVRAAAAEALGELKDTLAVKALIETLKTDTEASVRRAAAWALGELKDGSAILALSDALRGDADPEVRHNAAEALGQIDDARAVGALRDALQRDKDLSVRKAIISALGEIEDSGSATALFPALKDSDPEIRRAAADALGSIENKNSVEPLIPLTRDDVAEVRRAAVDALGSLEDKRALPAFAHALGDSDVEVRRAAANAIGGLDELHQAPPELFHALQDSDPEVRHNAVQALGNIDDPAGVAPLAALLKDNDVEIRRAAVEALEDLNDPAATQALRAALKDSDAEVRRNAAKALGNRHQ